MTAMFTELDPQQLEACAGHVISIYSGSMLSYLIDIGHRTGLLAAVAQGPGTSDEISARAGLTERYVREWLAALVTGNIVEYDPATETYTLPLTYAAVLTGGPLPLATFAALNTHLGKHVHEVARAFREGGGVPYAAYRPEFTDVMDNISRVYFDTALIDGCLPAVPGLTEQLESGAQVADVCCGTGHSLVVLGRRFPASTFVGYDMDDGAIARAQAEAAGAGLTNVRFEVVDAAHLDVHESFDVVLVFVMKEPQAADRLEDNIGNPFAPVLYGTSTLHCLTVSLAHGGAGIGTCFGQGLARRLLTDAGFTVVSGEPAPGDPADALYVSRKEGAAR